MAFDPNDDFGMDDFNFDDLDFNIEDYTSQVDFDGGQGAADHHALAARARAVGELALGEEHQGREGAENASDVRQALEQSSEIHIVSFR